jgi:hypothetical protein
MLNIAPVDLSGISSSEVHEAERLAQAALATSPQFELRELSVHYDHSQLLITGRVHCFYHKQLAQETVRPYAQELGMVNQVQVLP